MIDERSQQNKAVFLHVSGPAFFIGQPYVIWITYKLGLEKTKSTDLTRELEHELKKSVDQRKKSLTGMDSGRSRNRSRDEHQRASGQRRRSRELSRDRNGSGTLHQNVTSK